MNGFRCFAQDDPLWATLSALQRSVFMELVLHMEWRTVQYRVGAKAITVPRGCTIFSRSGLAQRAGVEETLARMTVDRLEELGVLNKITAYTEAQFPSQRGPVIHAGIPPLIHSNSQSHRNPPTLVRFKNAEAFLNPWADRSGSKNQAEIQAEIPPTIQFDGQKANESAPVGPPSAGSAGSAVSAT